MKFAITLIALCSSAYFSPAAFACEPIRIGYPDQERPPYWLGTGSEVPIKPGASAELLERFAGKVGCTANLKRLPVMRIRHALASGELDFAPLDSSAMGSVGIAFPNDKNHQPDITRAIPLNIVVFVRSSDRIPQATEPVNYFQDKSLGITLGASYRVRMQKLGLKTDSGAVNIARNFEKLLLNRIDGFAVSVTYQNNMDAYVAHRYKGAIVRLSQPLFTDHIWLATNEHYYAKHKGQVDELWSWLGSSGTKEFDALLKEYSQVTKKKPQEKF